MESADEAEQYSEENESIDGGSDEGGIPLVDNFNVSHMRPSQHDSDINFSAGGGERSRAEKIEESQENLEKRRQGAKRADEREMVRRAARRVVVFGVEVSKSAPVQTRGKHKSKGKRAPVPEGEAEMSLTEVRKAEALMSGMVVEPSFAKGNWSLRWRE